jgi:hypothetical protein
MSQPDCLKLLALDDEDLSVLSAHVQDAVMKVGDMEYLPREGRFALVVNRFIWEKCDGRRADFERRRTALVFDRVKAARTSRLRRDRPDAVLELLAISFEPGEAPGGSLTLIFAGGAAVRLEVECIEARLADLGAAWATTAMPEHDLSADTASA